MGLTTIKITSSEVQSQIDEIQTALGAFQADRVDTDYKVDIKGYNNLNQAYSAAKGKRSGAMGASNAIAVALSMVIEAMDAVDANAIEG